MRNGVAARRPRLQGLQDLADRRAVVVGGREAGARIGLRVDRVRRSSGGGAACPPARGGAMPAVGAAEAGGGGLRVRRRGGAAFGLRRLRAAAGRASTAGASPCGRFKRILDRRQRRRESDLAPVVCVPLRPPRHAEPRAGSPLRSPKKAGPLLASGGMCASQLTNLILQAGGRIETCAALQSSKRR